MDVVRGAGESQPDPMENFFSAFAIVWRRIFSAFGVRVLACINVIPYGFGVVGVAGWTGVDGVGEALRSAGEEGRPGQFVLESDEEDEEDPDVEDPESDMEDRELLLGVRVNADPPKRDFAGDVVME